MQVKKFEARSMKEALDLVKSQLGPEAIILSARDIRKGYGLVGQNSVEITAAISEESLQKLRFVESRILPKDREKVQRASARTQKQVIEKFTSKLQAQVVEPVITRRYADIEDEILQAPIPTAVAETRIKSAAQRAFSALQSNISQLTAGGVNTAGTQALNEKDIELRVLKNELQEMKKLIADFQKVPQNMVHSFPGSRYGLPHEASSVFERLVGTGMQEELSAQILLECYRKLPAGKFKNKSMIEGWVAKYILETTAIAEMPTAPVHVFLGPAGLGKTSSMVKVAARLVIEQKKKVALVTCDMHKVGASEQMKIYAQILNVPFAVLRSPQDWPLLRQRLPHIDYVLVDFPAWSMKSIDEITTAKQWISSLGVHKAVHLVLSALGKTNDLLEIGKRFSTLPVSDVIFTGVDEASEFGNIYQYSQSTKTPVMALGTGVRVPEDFEFASKERILDLLFKLGKIKKGEG